MCRQIWRARVLGRCPTPGADPAPLTSWPPLSLGGGGSLDLLSNQNVLIELINVFVYIFHTFSSILITLKLECLTRLSYHAP